MRPPARFLVVLACLLALAGLSACGSDSGSGSALDNSLGYLPKDAPFAVAVDTDVDGSQIQNLDKLVKKFPFGAQIRDGLLQNLAKGTTGVDLEKDVVPLLGNPFVIGAADGSSFLSGSDKNGFVAAIEVSDEGKLNDLLDKTGAKEKGEQSGAKIYDADGTEFAVDDGTVVFAGSRDLLNQALDRHDGDDKLDEDRFNSSQEGLGDPGILRAFVNVQSLLASSPSTKDALKVKWIGALRDLGLNATIQEDAVQINFQAKTDKDGLTDADLPIASGPEAPPVVERPGEIGIGVRDIGQIESFAETVAQAIVPSDYGDFAAAKTQLEKQLNVDLEKDVLAQLSGNISASVSLSGDFGLTAEPKDPAAFKRTLARVAPVLPTVVDGAGLGPVALSKPKNGQDLYALAQPDGDGVVFGVVNGVFVLANDANRAGRLATEAPTPVEGAQGSVVLKADAEQLGRSLLKKLAGGLGVPDQLKAAILRPLGDLTGSLEAETDGVSGTFRLTIK